VGVGRSGEGEASRECRTQNTSPRTYNLVTEYLYRGVAFWSVTNLVTNYLHPHSYPGPGGGGGPGTGTGDSQGPSPAPVRIALYWAWRMPPGPATSEINQPTAAAFFALIFFAPP
jgi:hypothetical protein